MTASGETFNQHALTAAHRTLPLGTEATVTNLETGQSVTVTINDRGPYVPGRQLDLSQAAAQQIGLTKKGVAKVKIEAKRPPAKKGTRLPEKRESVPQLAPVSAFSTVIEGDAMSPKTCAAFLGVWRGA